MPRKKRAVKFGVRHRDGSYTPGVVCSDRGPCNALHTYLEEDSDSRGITHLQVFQFQTREIRHLGYRYKRSSRSSERGILFNYCPWCGSDFRPLTQGESIIPNPERE